MPGRFRSPKRHSRPSAATGSRAEGQGLSGRAASQTGLPVDPSRRIRLVPFHSTRSALPAVNISASQTGENGMSSAPSKRLSESVR